MSISLYNFNQPIDKIYNSVNDIKNVIEYFKNCKFNPNTKTIIYVNGITGSGKSMISKKIYDYLSNNNVKTYILSKDDFRYTENGYVYEKNYEVIVSQRYKDMLRSLVNLSRYETIILDNTHINHEKIKDTREVYKNYKLNELIISLAPFGNLERHRILNIHEVSMEGIKKQIEELNKHKPVIRDMGIKTIYFNRQNDEYFTENQIQIMFKILNTLMF